MSDLLAGRRKGVNSEIQVLEATEVKQNGDFLADCNVYLVSTETTNTD